MHIKKVGIIQGLTEERSMLHQSVISISAAKQLNICSILYLKIQRFFFLLRWGLWPCNQNTLNQIYQLKIYTSLKRIALFQRFIASVMKYINFHSKWFYTTEGFSMKTLMILCKNQWNKGISFLNDYIYLQVAWIW